MPRKRAIDPKLSFRMRHIKLLSDVAAEMDKSEPVLHYGAHTLLKLICVSSYSHGFCTIAQGEQSKSAGYDGAVYLDLFAGPGLVRISETGDFVAGSPLAVSSHKKFDYSVFIEKAPRSRDMLLRRLEGVLERDKFQVIAGDCNERIGQVVDEIKTHYTKPIVLAFVDPEGMEVKFETLKTISSKFKSVDFMINVNAGADRVAATIVQGQQQSVPIFNDYFGDQASKILIDLANGVKVDARYSQLVMEVLGRTKGNIIPIFEKGQVLKYSILSYTRETRSGSPWTKIWDHIAEMLAGVDGEDAKRTLDIVKNRGDGFIDRWMG